MANIFIINYKIGQKLSRIVCVKLLFLNYLNFILSLHISSKYINGNN